MSGDLENPLVTRGHGKRTCLRPYVVKDLMVMGIVLLILIAIVGTVGYMDAFYPIDSVYVSSLTASISNGTSSWDTDISIDFPVRYPKDLSVSYDARASLLPGNRSVSAAMAYSSDRLKLLLHADFPREKDEADGIVSVDLRVEANVTLLHDATEMRSFLTIECNHLKIQFRRGVGRLYGSSKYGHSRTFRNGRWYHGVDHQELRDYLYPTDHLTPGVPY